MKFTYFRAFLLASTFCLLTLSSAVPSRAVGSLQVLPRTPTGGVPGPPPISISPRRAAAFGALLLCGLLLLQYAHRRQLFILAWAAGWFLIAPAMLLTARGYSSLSVARGAVGLSQFFGICTVTLFLWSADLYRRTEYLQPKHLKALGLVGVWFVAAPLLLGVRSVLVPGYLVAAAVLVAAGSMYAAVLIERRLLGAGLVAFVLFGLAFSNLTTALTLPAVATAEQFSFGILVLNVELYAVGALAIHLLVFEDMTYELRTTNQRLEVAREELLEAAITDPLTGCYNRRFLEQVMDRELQRHIRFNLPLALLFIDVDRFKAINDSLGHDAGDRVLQYVARFLKRHIREADYVFRWGGDEFLALMTCTSEEARRKAAALKATFDAAPEAAQLPRGIGLSIGWTEVPDGTTNLMPLVREADARMYQDKTAR